jgi:hypothetical protein
MIASVINVGNTNTFDIIACILHSRVMGSHRRAHVGRYFSDGAVRLWRLIEAGALTLEDVGRAGSWSRGLPHHWLYGDRRPSLGSALVLERLFGIPVAAWASAPTEPFTLPPQGSSGASL